MFAFGAFLAVSCAGAPIHSRFVQDLEHELKNRRTHGVTQLRLRIASLVEENELPDIRKTNIAAARAATAGKLKIASAAWWGWESKNATYALNAALSAPLDVLIVPAMSGPWIVGPLFLDGPRTILFEPGCTVLAAKDAFLDKNDCLLSVANQYGVTLSGYGARLVMHKADYAKEPYAMGQWRHALSIIEGGSILVEGLSIERSGGDGVYIGQRRGATRPIGITLRDLDLKENNRQGVSVIAAYGFLMEYCRVIGTQGSAPQAGIDFEPNTGTYGLVDCLVRFSIFKKNAGAAVHVHLVKMAKTQPPVSINVENSVVLGSPLAVWVGGLSNGVRGAVDFSKCTIQGIQATRRSATLSTWIR